MNAPIHPNPKLAILPFHAFRSDVLAEDFIGFATICRHRFGGKAARVAGASREAARRGDMRHHAGHRPAALSTHFLIL